jgi:hypothetical protein
LHDQEVKKGKRMDSTLQKLKTAKAKKAKKPKKTPAYARESVFPEKKEHLRCAGEFFKAPKGHRTKQALQAVG